ncbi:hypothetical protein BDV93DRAFT_525671 [Ceratobasidium sp. AG-I]|nr:hypothetical protein BDV93DRAFT_525671 [Ceratobasidium sp. AG-I]
MHDATIQFSKGEDRVGGTLRWMAPELVFCAGAGSNLEGQVNRSLSETLMSVKECEVGGDVVKLCKETDVYALGMTMLELLTGKQPFWEIENGTAVILALEQGKRPHCPKETLDQSHRGASFWEILQKCWAQTPADRPTVNQVEAMMLQLDPK